MKSLLQNRGGSAFLRSSWTHWDYCPTKFDRRSVKKRIYDSEYDQWSYGTMGLIDPSQTSGGILYSYTALEVNRYLNYGLSLRIGTSLPVNDRCKLIIQYSPEYIWRAPFNKSLSPTLTFRHFAEIMLCVRI